MKINFFYPKSINIFWISVICFNSCFYAQSLKEITPQTYVAYKTSETITIDGKTLEEDWQKAKWSRDFIDIEGVKTPKYQTNVKMLWDDNYYYILAEIKEPHIWGDITDHDAVIFYNNDFEVFIDPDGDTHNYYELEINALNTVWDLFINKPYREKGNIVLNDWNYTGLKSAVTIQGTLNNSNDIDKGWTLEIAIPFKDLRTAYGQHNVPENQFYRVNFSRVNWDYDLNDGKYSRKKNDNGKYLPEYNWVWSPMGVINMHLPEHWGYVYFSSKKTDANETFIRSNDEKIKWQLYQVFRNIKSTKQEVKSIKDLKKYNIKVEGKILTPSIEHHSLGWTISIKSIFTNYLLSIREDGQFFYEKQ